MRSHIIGGMAATVIVLGGAAAGLMPKTVEAASTAADSTAQPAPTPPTPEEAFNSECGACHIAYPAAFLPARSWQAITGDLAHHFGEDASLDPETTQIIADYLIANAADSANGDARILRGLSASETPLRITETRWWVRRHNEIPASVYGRPGIKSKANCLACHGGGAYGDD